MFVCVPVPPPQRRAQPTSGQHWSPCFSGSKPSSWLYLPVFTTHCFLLPTSPSPPRLAPVEASWWPANKRLHVGAQLTDRNTEVQEGRTCPLVCPAGRWSLATSLRAGWGALPLSQQGSTQQPICTLGKFILPAHSFIHSFTHLVNQPSSAGVMELGAGVGGGLRFGVGATQTCVW